MSLAQDNTSQPTPAPPASSQPGHPVVRPRVDLFAGQEALLILAELPGVAPQDLSIHLDAQVLQIDAVGHVATNSSDTNAANLSPVRYQRTFTLRTEVDADRIQARLRNGLLDLRLPKTEAARSRRIPIGT